MTTKEQERKALEQIRKIVAGLGEESYVGKAFDGCFEMAEKNIDDDFWNSMKDQRDLNEAEAEKWMGIAEAQKKEKEDLRAELSASRELREQLENDKGFLLDKLHESQENCKKNWNNFRAQEERAEALEQEIIRLKAKLYDLICK